MSTATRWRHVLSIASILLIIAACGTAPDTGGNDVSWSEIASGSSTRARSEGVTVARSRSEAERLKEELGIRSEQFTPSEIDFDTEAVVAVRLGERPTGGYRIAVDGASRVDGEIVISASEVAPDPGDMVTQAITYPYTVLRVTASPDEEVRVDK